MPTWLLLTRCVQQLGLDEVLLMPEYEPPHVDKKETIDEKHRLNMLMLAINGIEGLDIEPLSWNVRESVILMTP